MSSRASHQATPVTENCCCCSACQGRVRRMEVMINQLFCFLSDFIPEEVSGKIQELQQEDFDKNWRDEELTKIQPDPTVYGSDKEKSIRSYRAPRQHRQYAPIKQQKTQKITYDKRPQQSRQNRYSLDQKQTKQIRYNENFNAKKQINQKRQKQRQKEKQKQRQMERQKLSTYSQVRHFVPEPKPLYHGKPEYKPGPSLKQKFRKQFTLEQKRQIVNQVQEGCKKGQKIADICAKYNVSDRSYQRWKKLDEIRSDSPTLFDDGEKELVIAHANF